MPCREFDNIATESYVKIRRFIKMLKINLSLIWVLFIIRSSFPSIIGTPPDLCNDKYWDETMILVCSAGSVTYDKSGQKDSLLLNTRSTYTSSLFGKNYCFKYDSLWNYLGGAGWHRKRQEINIGDSLIVFIEKEGRNSAVPFVLLDGSNESMVIHKSLVNISSIKQNSNNNNALIQGARQNDSIVREYCLNSLINLGKKNIKNDSLNDMLNKNISNPNESIDIRAKSHKLKNIIHGRPVLDNSYYHWLKMLIIDDNITDYDQLSLIVGKYLYEFKGTKRNDIVSHLIQVIEDRQLNHGKMRCILRGLPVFYNRIKPFDKISTNIFSAYLGLLGSKELFIVSIAKSQLRHIINTVENDDDRAKLQDALNKKLVEYGMPAY
jgi:hypothetical protein